MPSIDDANNIIDQLDKSTPEAWLALMRYMAHSMIADEHQSLLAEIICREAQRRAERKTHHLASDEIGLLLSELGLKLSLDR
jgi:hypothetical protein